MRKLLTTVALAALATSLVACGNGGGSSFVAPPAPPPPPPPPPPPTTVTISGAVTFDFVGSDSTTNGLDYGDITQRPARGIVVEALGSDGGVLTTTLTDDSGNYSVTVASQTDVRIRAKAQMVQTAGATWDFRTTDNTNGNALYVLDGSIASSGSANSTRNLNAGSGWDGTSYASTRASAPFSILYPIYDTIQQFAAADPDVAFPALEFRWSANNRPASGDLTTGDIGTSFYNGEAVYILGAADNDTDEFDHHIIVHEWGHYFENKLSRSDSIGGPHGSGDVLDPRVAMGEGFGNALSGISLNDPIYRDTSGAGQASGFSFNLESNVAANPGWYNEGSVQSVLYDLFDAADDGADTISLGIGPIYNAFVSPDYRNTPFYTTIFAYLHRIETDNASSASAIRAIATERGINGTGPDGAGETADAGAGLVLPVYNPLTVGTPIEICSVDDFGTFNKLGVHRYLSFDAPSAGAYTFTMTRTSGDTTRDPDFGISLRGQTVAAGESGVVDTETLTATLEAGLHVIDAYDALNLDGSTMGYACFSFAVTQ